MLLLTTDNDSDCWGLSPSPCLSAVGFELSSVGRLQQQQLCGDPVRACDVFSLQSADGSSAAHANTAQPGQLQHQHTHHLPHRHTHQSRASHQGKMHLTWHIHTAAFNSLFLVPPHSANALQWFYHTPTTFTAYDECRHNILLLPHDQNQ